MEKRNSPYLVPPSPEQRREMEDELYKQYYANIKSREEFDKDQSGPEAEEKAKRRAFQIIQTAYQDEALTDAIWKFIQATRNNQTP